MASINTEIECLARLQELAACADEILAFFVEEKIITTVDVKDIKSSFSVPKSLCLVIKGLSEAGKLQLVEYEWQVLPVERIKLLIVTNRVTKEFGYNT